MILKLFDEFYNSTHGNPLPTILYKLNWVFFPIWWPYFNHDSIQFSSNIRYSSRIKIFSMQNVYIFDKKIFFYPENLFPKTIQFIFISVLYYLCECFAIAKLWCCFVLHIERLLSSFMSAYDETGYFRVNNDIKHSNDVHHHKRRWMKWMFAITEFFQFEVKWMTVNIYRK